MIRVMSAETSKREREKKRAFFRRKEARVSSREEAPIDDEEARAVGVASEENDRMRAKRKCAAGTGRCARAWRTVVLGDSASGSERN